MTKKKQQHKPTAAEHRTALRETMTLADAASLRHICEQQLQALLHELCAATGLDLCRVEVMTVATAQRRIDAPHRVPFSVRIDLAV